LSAPGRSIAARSTRGRCRRGSQPPVRRISCPRIPGRTKTPP